jgi:hypothetical protein
MKMSVSPCIKKTEILEFEIDRLDRLVGAEAFVEFARVDEIFQFHLVERATLAGLHRIGLHGDPEAAITIDDGAGCNLISIDFWHCLVPAGRRHPRPRHVIVDRQKSGPAKAIGQDYALFFSGPSEEKTRTSQTRIGINT